MLLSLLSVIQFIVVVYSVAGVKMSALSLITVHFRPRHTLRDMATLTARVVFPKFRGQGSIREVEQGISG